jgi:tripartite-type tricarboxylate transporter receptor subunit TctC
MSTTRIRRALLGALLGLVACGAQAQGYPNRTIALIVPYAPGGPTDVAARIMAERLGQRLGQSMVIQNMGGAGGVIGTESAARAKPDGYTLYFAVNSMAIFPHIRPASSPLPFNPATDFLPIGGVAESAHVLLASKTAGFTTVAGMVAAAKQKPDAVSYGSSGVGGTTHLPLALFAHQAGIKLLHVPYKGAAPAMLDTIAGRVSMSTPGYSDSINEAVRAGTLIPLAVTSATRLPFMPDVPTLAESGYPDMVFPIWYAVFAPKGTPAEIVNKLSAELKAIAAEPEYAKKLYAQGNVAAYLTPAQLGQRLNDDIKRLGERIKASGLSFEE